MNSIYPNPTLGLVAYFPAARLVRLALPGGGPVGPLAGEKAPAGH